MVALLEERGLIRADQPIVRVSHATEDDVKGNHVIGVLPFHLAALAAQVTVIPLNLEFQDKNRSLPLERLRQVAGPAETFVVRSGKADPEEYGKTVTKRHLLCDDLDIPRDANDRIIVQALDEIVGEDGNLVRYTGEVDDFAVSSSVSLQKLDQVAVLAAQVRKEVDEDLPADCKMELVGLETPRGVRYLVRAVWGWPRATVFGSWFEVIDEEVPVSAKGPENKRKLAPVAAAPVAAEG
jgi:hypothetical protein